MSSVSVRRWLWCSELFLFPPVWSPWTHIQQLLCHTNVQTLTQTCLKCTFFYYLQLFHPLWLTLGKGWAPRAGGPGSKRRVSFSNRLTGNWILPPPFTSHSHTHTRTHPFEALCCLSSTPLQYLIPLKPCPSFSLTHCSHFHFGPYRFFLLFFFPNTPPHLPVLTGPVRCPITTSLSPFSWKRA